MPGRLASSIVLREMKSSLNVELMRFVIVCCVDRGRYILKNPAILTIENVTLYYPFKYTSNILLV